MLVLPWLLTLAALVLLFRARPAWLVPGVAPAPIDPPPRFARVAAVVIAIGAFVVRWHYAKLYPAEVSELAELMRAQNFSLFQTGAGDLASLLHAPLPTGAFAIWRPIVDATGIEGAMELYRLPILLLSAAATLVLFRLGRLVFSWQAGLAAAALWAFLPVPVKFGVLLANYLPETVTALFLLERLATYVIEKRPVYGSMVAAAALSLGTGYLTGLTLLPAAAVICIVAWRRGEVKAIGWMAGMSLLLAAPLLVGGAIGAFAYLKMNPTSAMDPAEAARLSASLNHVVYTLDHSISAGRFGTTTRIFFFQLLGNAGPWAMLVSAVLLLVARKKAALFAVAVFLLYEAASLRVVMNYQNLGCLVPLGLLALAGGLDSVLAMFRLHRRSGALLALAATFVVLAHRDRPMTGDRGVFWPEMGRETIDQLLATAPPPAPVLLYRVVSSPRVLLYILCSEAPTPADRLRCASWRNVNAARTPLLREKRYGREFVTPVWELQSTAPRRDLLAELRPLFAAKPWADGFIVVREFAPDSPVYDALDAMLFEKCPIKSRKFERVLLHCPPDVLNAPPLPIRQPVPNEVMGTDEIEAMKREPSTPGVLPPPKPAPPPPPVPIVEPPIEKPAGMLPLPPEPTDGKLAPLPGEVVAQPSPPPRERVPVKRPRFSNRMEHPFAVLWAVTGVAAALAFGLWRWRRGRVVGLAGIAATLWIALATGGVLRFDFPQGSVSVAWLAALGLCFAPIVTGVALGLVVRGKAPPLVARLSAIVAPVALVGLAVFLSVRVVELGFWDWVTESLLLGLAFALAAWPRAKAGLAPFVLSAGVVVVALVVLEVWWRAHPAQLWPVVPLSQVTVLNKPIDLEQVCASLFPEQLDPPGEDPTVDRWGRSGVWKVMHLGDSMTLGSEVPDRFVVLLHKWHQDEAHLNLGVSETSTDIHLGIARAWVPRLKPDEVVLHVFPGNDLVEMDRSLGCCEWGPLLGSDPADRTQGCRQMKFRFPLGRLFAYGHAPYLLRIGAQESEIGRRVHDAMFRLIAKSSTSGHVKATSEQGLARMRPVLTAMRDELAAQGVKKFTVLVMPVRGYQEWLRAESLAIVALARELGLDVHDSWEEMVEADRRIGSPDFYETRIGNASPHFGPVGHEVYAKWADGFVGRE